MYIILPYEKLLEPKRVLYGYSVVLILPEKEDIRLQLHKVWGQKKYQVVKHIHL